MQKNRPKQVKPPLGVLPRENWLRIRYLDLLDAITRYEASELSAKREWIVELLSVYDELEEIYNGKSTN